MLHDSDTIDTVYVVARKTCTPAIGTTPKLDCARKRAAQNDLGYLMNIKAGLLAAVTVASGTLILPAPAMAAPGALTVCEPGTSWINEWNAKSSINKITHASGFVVPEGGTGSRTKTAEFQNQLEASLSYSTTATISATIAKTGLEAEVGYTIAVVGSRTSTESTSVTTNVTRSGTHIFFMGRREATGSFNGGNCVGTGLSTQTVKGKLTSYDIAFEGGVWCGEKPTAGSFKAKAKIYCD